MDLTEDDYSEHGRGAAGFEIIAKSTTHQRSRGVRTSSQWSRDDADANWEKGRKAHPLAEYAYLARRKASGHETTDRNGTLATFAGDRGMD